jgi:hypothetical protein
MSSIWATTVSFCSLFEDIEVRNYTERYGSDFNRRLKVDVTLDMKERLQHKLLAGGHKKMEQADTRLPRISIQIANVVPDVERYSGKNMKRIITESADQQIIDVQPFPINIDYTVSVWAKYFEHYAQIVENIIPWFDPYVVVGIKERNFNIEREVKVSLNSISQNAQFELEGGSARLIRGDLGFSVETYAYKSLNDLRDSVIFSSNVVIVDVVNPITSETVSISGDASDIV